LFRKGGEGVVRLQRELDMREIEAMSSQMRIWE
jgi:hypothetical protein